MTTIFKDKKLYFSAGILILMLTFAISAQKYSKLTLDGVTVWAISVLPSVFMFFVLSSLLSATSIISTLSLKFSPLSKRLFHVSGLSFYALFMSLLSGYPTGAKITCDLYLSGVISKDEAIKSSVLSSTGSASFFLSTIGNMIGSQKTAFVILICHLFSVFFSAFLFRGKKKEIPTRTFTFKRVDNVIYESVYSSVISLLMLGGIITFYYVFIEMLFDLKLLFIFEKPLSILFGDENLSRALLTGVFESIKGIKLLSLCSHKLVLPLIGFTITFGGFSVITQTAIYLKNAKIKTARFVLIKLLQAVICFVLLFVIYSL